MRQLQALRALFQVIKAMITLLVLIGVAEYRRQMGAGPSPHPHRAGDKAPDFH